MSDRAQTIIKFLQYAIQILGVILSLLGGGQVVASKISPDAYGGYSEPATGNMLGGVLLTIGAPAVAWAVRKVWTLTRGKAGTPQLDFLAASASVTQLELYLESDLTEIRTKVSDRYTKAEKAEAVKAKAVAVVVAK